MESSAPLTAELQRLKAENPTLDDERCMELFLQTFTAATATPAPSRRRAVSDANGTQRSLAATQGRVRKNVRQQNGSAMARGRSRQSTEMSRSVTLGHSPASHKSHSTLAPAMGKPSSAKPPAEQFQPSSDNTGLFPNSWDPSFIATGGGDLMAFIQTRDISTPSIDIPIAQGRPSQSIASSINSVELSSLGSSPPIVTPIDMSRNTSTSSFAHGMEMMTLQSDAFPDMGSNAQFFDDDDIMFQFCDLYPGLDSGRTKLNFDLAGWPSTSSIATAEITATASPKWKRTESDDNEIVLDCSPKRDPKQTEQQQNQQSPTQQPRRQSKYIRKPQPRVFCHLCPDNKEGFRGDHEYRRHFDRMHAAVKKVYIVKDLTEDKRLSRCKACKSKKRYNMDYNATAHLRRQHFNPERDPKVQIPSNLRDWVEVVEVEPTEQERQRWRRAEQREQQNLTGSGASETMDNDWQQHDREIVAMINQPSESLLSNAAEAMSTATNVAIQTWQDLHQDGMDIDDLTSFAGEFPIGSIHTASQDPFDVQFTSDYADARLYAASGGSFFPDKADIISMNTQVMQSGFLPSNPDDLSQWLS